MNLLGFCASIDTTDSAHVQFSAGDFWGDLKIQIADSEGIIVAEAIVTIVEFNKIAELIKRVEYND